MQLYFQELGDDGLQPIVILHGLFGASDNWLTIGRQLATEYKVYLIDQRNHGKSPKDDLWDYTAMANDLKILITDHVMAAQNKAPIVLGHSMGGKTAMFLACQYPELVSKLVIADMGVCSYPLHHNVILDGLNAINLDTLESRKEADKILAAYVPEFMTRAFLLKSLYREDTGFAWRINLPVITRDILNILVALPSDFSYDGPSIFLKGSKSDYIKTNDWNNVLQHFPSAVLKSIEDAGHWLHAEKPKEFLEALLVFLKK